MVVEEDEEGEHSFEPRHLVVRVQDLEQEPFHKVEKLIDSLLKKHARA